MPRCVTGVDGVGCVAWSDPPAATELSPGVAAALDPLAGATCGASAGLLCADNPSTLYQGFALGGGLAGGGKPKHALGAGRSLLQRLGLATKGAASLPKLSGSIAESFEGGVYTARTFKAGTTFFRAEERGAAGPGRFLGTEAVESRAEAEAAYNIAKWRNPAHALRRYELTEDVTLYYGRVAGGEGYQALIPRGTEASSILRRRGMRPLR